MIAETIIAADTETVQTIVSFFGKGGLFMWPLLVCSIVAVTTMILRSDRACGKKMSCRW